MLVLSLASLSPSQSAGPSAFAPTPSPRQLAWHEVEYYAFIHFGPNTFTSKEWGDGREDPRIFYPTQLDCEQWAKTFKAAGMRGIIITAKHHDGFCLWPSKDSTHTVAASPWMSGKGDVLKLLSEACKKHGLKMGVYLSPWDRNHPSYGTAEYNEVFKRTLRDVLTNYGPIFEVWFDGANGEGPNGKKQEYDWPGFIKVVRECQPNAVIFSDAGPDIRWVGNESGHSAPTSWSTIDRDRYVPGTPHYKELTEGKEGGKDWVPSESDVSIRPGWFYRASEDTRVKTGEQLFDLYLRSVGQNSAFLLNVPPDTRGLIHENDIAALMSFKRIRDAHFAKVVQNGAKAEASSGFPKVGRNGQLSETWIATTTDRKPTLTLTWPKAENIGLVELNEDILQGQRVAEFTLELKTAEGWKVAHTGTTIGRRRILKVPTSGVSGVRVSTNRSLSVPMIKNLKVYQALQ